MALRRLIYTLICSVLVVCQLAISASAAEKIVGAGFKADSIELIDVLQVVDSNNAQIAIDVPADATGQKLRMTLLSANSATTHRWAIFTLSNPDLVVHDFVLQIPRRGFVKSGSCGPPPVWSMCWQCVPPLAHVHRQ